MKSSAATRLLSATFTALLAFTPAAAWAVCGDGIPERIEQCDDGNVANGDCCDSQCNFEPVESPCTDGNQCTFDFCDGQGFCSSFPNQQAECDDGNACTVGDFCNSDGFCTGGTLEDGSTCFDDAFCGGRGQCFFGSCFGDPADCSGFGACNTAVCNQETASCDITQLDDGTPCDNPNPCTDPGVCQSGECQQPPRDCAEFKDDCNDAFCDVEAGGCFQIPKENGTTCNDSDACTDAGTCDAGDCITTPTDCSQFKDQCNDADCDPETGCFASPVEDGTGCNDGDNCSTSDVCTGGTCDGTPVDCSELADACNNAFCDPQTGQCDTTPVEGPATCDDGNPCTVGDTCSNGVCAGTPKDCSNFDTACTTGACGRSGECFALPNEDGGLCDDGDKCTSDDQCVAGECTGTPLDCSGSSDQCNVGFCNGDTGGCESDPLPGPEECDDGNTCSTGDTCSNGACVGTPKDCSGADGECLEGTCNAETGACEGLPVENGTTCSDGDLCTTGDQCTRGTCAGTPKDCSASGGNCLIGECNPDTGQCVGEPAENGTTCNDGDLCTTDDSCAGGECVGDPVTCKPSLAACKESFCSAQSGQCEERNADNGTVCDDGFLCTLTDICTNGTCAGSEKDCSSLDAACVTGDCNEDTGSCVALPRTNGIECSDGNPCTLSDTCSAGACASGAPKDCTSLDADCRTGQCDTETGTCVAQPRENGTTCSDGNPCTVSDSCTAGTCTSGAPKDCSSLDAACVTGQCNGETGNCVAQPRENGTTCSDGNPCTVSDSCTAGACTSGSPKDCSSLNAPCRSGVCNTQSGNCESVNAADTTPCNDGAFCTATDTCTGGTCTGTGDPCPGNLICNGQCNEAADSCNAASGTPCESDGNPCTDNVCNGQGSCVSQANDAGCDDGLFCTTNDQCADGACVGEAICPQTSSCGDTCDEANDACRTCGHPFSNSRCIVNAIFVLQGALGIRECELCTCDVDSDGQVMATDALKILRTCTALPGQLECPSGEPTTTTTTIQGGCEAELHNRVFNEKFTCAQTFTDGDPFCADSNEQDTIRFTHLGDGLYEVRDVPDTGFVMTGVYDCSTFTWSGGSPGEYNEGGFWTFSGDTTTFSGSSAYVAVDESYVGGCNETGAESPATPPNPEPIAPCE